MFESADGVLIEYAEAAESNAVQAGFFEGRRELWKKKDLLISVFRNDLSDELFKFMQPSRRADAPGAEVLSLVSKDTFERSLALTTICEQAVKKRQELYYALAQRLGAITGKPATPYKEIPAGPYQLAGIFESASNTLVVERQVLLVLFTLFEREVIRNSPPWHDELNETLRDQGILPNLKFDIKRDADQLRPERPENQDQTSQLGQSPDNRGRYQSASSLPRYSGHAAASASTATSGAYGNHNRAGVGIPRTDGFGYTDPRGSPVSEPEGTDGSWDAELGHSATGSDNKVLGDQLLGRIRELLTAQRTRRGKGGAVRPDPVAPASTSVVAAAIDSPQVVQAAPMPETGVFEPGAQKVVVPRALLEKLRMALATQRARIKDTVGDNELSYFDEDTIDIVGMLFEVMLNDNRLNNTVKALLSHLHTPYLKLAVRDRGFLKRPDHPARRILDNMIEAGSRWVDENDLTAGIYPRLQRIVDLIMKAGDQPLQLLQELDEGLSADIKLRTERQQAREVRTVESEKGKARLDEARKAAGSAMQQLLATTATPAQFQQFINGAWIDYLTLLYLRSNGNTDTDIWHNALALSEKLLAYVDGLSRGVRPSEQDLDTLHEELQHRLGNAIPHYAAKVQQLFELFSTEREVTIVAPSPAVPDLEPPLHINLSSDGEALLKRLPKLPPGSWVVFHGREGDRVLKLSWFNRKTERFLFVDQTGAKALVVPLKKLANEIDREKAHVLLATGASYVESSLERAVNTLEESG